MLGLTGIFCYGKGGDKSKIREEFKRINYSVVEFHSSTATVLRYYVRLYRQTENGNWTFELIPPVNGPLQID